MTGVVAARRVALLGRQTECAALDQLVDAVHSGRSRSLVVRGQPGVGKSALLDYLVDRSSGFRVVRAAGVQSEMELAYAVVHQLCMPLLERLDRLPEPQRDALRTAFGLQAGEAPVGLSSFLARQGSREAMNTALATRLEPYVPR